MYKYLLTFLLLLTGSAAFADHLKGGFFTYQYLPGSSTATKAKYRVTLVLYMDCNARDGGQNSQVDAALNFTIFNAGTRAFIKTESVDVTSREDLSRKFDDECITGNQAVCYYKIITYQKEIEFDVNTSGYIISYQRCCRIGSIDNIAFSNTVGNTYSIEIPGQSFHTNNSASFAKNDTAVVCKGSFFTFPFAASDLDGDELEYEFCEAWVGGNQSQPAPNPSLPPPYSSVNYTSGYSGTNPMGFNVSIDSKTGLISGTAPSNIDRGEFVVTVCVKEKRNGQTIATSRKELHIQVGNCAPVKPTLNPEYLTCDGFTLTFQNQSPSPEIKTYLWDFGVSNTESDVSTAESPTFTYPAAGEYTLKAVVNRGLACADSTTANVKVFPGFVVDFNYSACDNNPTNFIDNTQTAFGVVNSWKWNFGDENTLADTSLNQNPAYTYPTGGKKTVQLIATNSKGCVDTATKDLTIIYKPFAGNDTIIVAGQQLQFEASGGSIYRWTPATGLSDPNIFNPIGTYDGSYDSIRYTVYVSNEIGCTDTASVAVRIFRTDPQVFVPTAFTPNNDGKNDVFVPIPVGMTQIEYFRVYNRWGQLVYSGNSKNGGWDGRINGNPQPSGTYAWLVKGTDFTGKDFFAKGTVTLIR